MSLGRPLQPIPDGVVCPLGHVWVEWIGDPDPFDDPEIEHAKLTGRITGHKLAVLERLRLEARIRHDGISIRRMVPLRILDIGGLKGLATEWIWGPHRHRPPGTKGSYIQAMAHRDAEAVLQSDERHEFRLRGAVYDEEYVELESRVLVPARVRLSHPELFKTGDPIRMRSVA